MSVINQIKRSEIIDSAQKVFARKGVETTTMNDIAEACNRSRRTIYTYFRNKSELLAAVIERELDVLTQKLSERAHSEKRSLKSRLSHMMIVHLETMYQIVMRSGSLKAEFFSNVRAVDKIRLKFDIEERDLFSFIIQQGINQKMFKPIDADTTATLLLYCLRGLEVPYINWRNRRAHKLPLRQVAQIFDTMVFNGLLVD